MTRTIKLLSCVFLVTLVVNGHESSLAAATQSFADTQAPDVQSEGTQPSLLAMVVSFLMPGDTRPSRQENQNAASAHLVASDNASLVSTITPMTSITIDTPQSQTGEAEAAAAKENEKTDADIEQEKARLELLLQQLTAKEKELTLLREKTSAAAQQLSAEKTRAEALEAQLNQKEQELAGICTQRDNHQQMSQELNRTRSSLELVKQQVSDIERQFTINNDQLDVAMQRIADLDLQLVAKEQEFTSVKSTLDMELASRDSQLVQAKRLLASVGKSLPKPAKLSPSNKNAFPQQAVARNTVDLSRVSEKLTSALQDDLKRGTVVLEQRGDKLMLALSSGELFGAGRVTMTTTGASLVKRIGVALRKFRPQSVEVAGHTDSIPVKYNPKRPFKDNAELSQARAENASRALLKGGLGADRVKAVGYADSQPIATNDTEEGRAKNRRVEIIVSQSAQPTASAGEKDGQAPGSSKTAIQKIATR